MIEQLAKTKTAEVTESAVLVKTMTAEVTESAVPVRTETAEVTESAVLDANWIGTRPAPAPTSAALPRDPRRQPIEDVIRSGGPSIVYQPVMALQTGAVIGAEALSRFDDTPSPAEWFRTAEAVGLGRDLELSAARAALEQLDPATWQRLGWNFLGLNLSSRAAFDHRFRLLLDGFPAHHLAIELTDDLRASTSTELGAKREALRDLGVRIAINAVECTPASIRMAIDLEPEILKLGVDFTAALVRDPSRRAEATSVLDRCRRHGVFVIAVGVEHGGELAALRELGIDAAQGHSIGLPRAVA